MRFSSLRQVLPAVAAVVLFCVVLAGQFQPHAQPGGTAFFAQPALAGQPDSRGDWWMAGHDARHTGRSPFTGPQSATLQWKFRSHGPGTGFTTAAIEADGTIYAGCGSNLAALDKSGRERWFLPLQGSVSSPLLSGDGTLYVTDGQTQLHCVTTDGALKWSITVPGGLHYREPMLFDGLVLLATQDGMLHAITAQGQESWTYGVPGQHIDAGPVADAAGSIYIALRAIGIQELSPKGKLLRTYPLTDSSIEELQLYADGSFLVRTQPRIYKLTREGQPAWTRNTGGRYIPAAMALRPDGTAYYVDNAGILQALSAQGQELWQFKSGTGIKSTPVLGLDGAVAVQDDQGTLTVLDLNGVLRFSKQLAGFAWYEAQARFTKDGELFTSGGGYLYGLGPDGTELWKYAAGGTFSASPLVGADGTIYAACMDGTLYVLNPDGTQRRQQQLDRLGMFTPALSADGTLLAIAGNKLCAVPPGGGTGWEYDTGGYLTSSPALDAAGMIYLGTDDGRLLALRLDGALAWAYQTNGHITGCGPAIGSDGMLYIGTAIALKPAQPDANNPSSLAGREDGTLYAVKPDGTLAWTFNAGSTIWSSPVIADDGTIYIGSTIGMSRFGGPQNENAPLRTGKLFALTPDGKEKWSYPLLETTQGSAALGPDGSVYISSWDHGITTRGARGASLYAFSPDGKLKWQGPYGCICTPCVGADGTVYSAGLDCKLYALRPDGTVLWSYQLGQLTAGSPVIAPDGTLYVGNSDGYLYAFKDP